AGCRTLCSSACRRGRRRCDAYRPAVPNWRQDPGGSRPLPSPFCRPTRQCGAAAMGEGAARPMGRREWALLLLLALAWGGIFLYSKLALAELTPLTVVLWRVVLAAAVLQLIVYLTGHRMPGSVGTWAAFFVMGAINNVLPFTLINWGQTQIASG